MLLQTCVSSFTPLIIIWVLTLKFCGSVEFNRTTLGVGFSPFVKRPENGKPIPGWETYEMEDITTMLKVINTRFRSVATFGVGAENVPFKQHETYKRMNSVALTGEAAGRINRERNNKTLAVYVGMWQSDQSVQMEAEILVALESSKIANDIYPGTVIGIVFTHWQNGINKDRNQQTLNEIQRFKNDTHALRLKVGSRQNCYAKTDKEIKELHESIIRESDFIICDVKPSPELLPTGPKAAFVPVGNDLLGFRNEYKRINPNIEVMGQTEWPSKGNNTWENIQNFQAYWEEVNKWSAKKNFQMWMSEAFDCPWKATHEHFPFSAGHLGWWKLRRNADVRKEKGYAEKIFEPPEVEEKPPTSPWVYVGAAVGTIVAITFIVLIVLLYLRVQKLQSILTSDEIHEFVNGSREDEDIEEALKFPYDKSYEMQKDKLNIKRDKLLGSGNFGSVFLATYENQGLKDIALKMTKSDCPKNALKSLLSEIKILTYLGKHPNIVSIHGAYTAELKTGLVYVGTELCTLGSLESYLRKSQTEVNSERYANGPMMKPEQTTETEIDTPQITFNEMVQWSHEIACGMEYLGTKHVVHADLATRNVLLSFDKTAKITDFGLSRRLYDYTNYVKQQQEPLPWRWMAIESLKRLEFSSKSDVWSYGVTLWEIFAMGDLPYPGLSWNLDFVDSLVNGLRMKSPPYATPEIHQIMVDCWHVEPNQRPTFTDLKLSTNDLIGNPQHTPNEIYSNGLL